MSHGGFTVRGMEQYRYPDPSPIESSVGALTELAEIAGEDQPEGGPRTFTVTAPPGYFPPGSVVTFTPNIPGLNRRKSTAEIQAEYAELDRAVVSKHQPLVDRAEALLSSVQGSLPSGVEFTRDAGRESPNMRVFAELTGLVRDLAKALAGR